MAEWQNGRNGYIRTIYGTRTLKSFILQRQYFTTYLIYPAIFMVQAADDDANDTDGF